VPSKQAEVFGFRLSGLPIVTQFMADLFTFTELTSLRQSRNADKCVHSAVCGTIETNRFIFIEKFHSARWDRNFLFLPGFPSSSRWSFDLSMVAN
jgi:hypothetical protein